MWNRVIWVGIMVLAINALHVLAAADLRINNLDAK